MLKLVSKFAMDFLPSVIATVVGAYIVNHYINNKPANVAATAAAISSVDGKKTVSKGDAKPAEKSADLGHALEPGVRAKGISEKAMTDKANTDKAAVTEKPAEKADKPSETASIPPVAPAESRRHQPAPREKAAAKSPPPAPAAEPAAAAATPPGEATPDANDLARAAIERLRGAEPSRSPETSRVVATPVAPTPVPAPVATTPA